MTTHGKPRLKHELKAKEPKALDAAIWCMPGRRESSTTVMRSGKPESRQRKAPRLFLWMESRQMARWLGLGVGLGLGLG